MRAIALLSAVAITASLAISVPGSVTENTALGSTPQSCEDMHGTTPPAASEDSYVIASVKNLVHLSVNQDKNVPGTSDPWRTKDFVQTAPIDLQGCLWKPIGEPDDGSGQSLGTPFTGSFDGSGYHIDNLAIQTGDFRGLFGVTDGATITRIQLLHVNVTATSGVVAAGTLVGVARGTTILESSATGSVSGTGNGIGGLVGFVAADSTVRHSFSAVSVTASGNAGGLVGVLDRSSIESSFATGTVFSAEDSVGGLVGGAQSTSGISQSFSRGDVTGRDGVGGLIGALPIGATLTVTDSYATGEVSGDTNVGGLVGRVSSGGGGEGLTVTNSFWDTQTTTQNATAENEGAGRTTAEMKSFATFTDTTSADLVQAWPIVDGWESFDPDDNKVWGIRSDLNDGYPFLLWEYETSSGVMCQAFHVSEEPAKQGDDYVIASVGNLVYLSVNHDVGSPQWRTRNFVQTAPIDLDGCLWKPVGTFASPFTGQYTGGGHPISNLTIVRESQDAGLFGRATNATIEQVVLEDVDIRETTGTTGAIVGQAEGTTIIRSSAAGDISGNAETMGGLVGFVRSTGGTSGVALREGSIGFSRSAVNVAFTGEPFNFTKRGGLVGFLFGDSTISNSVATGNVAGGSWTGGLVGGAINERNTITNSYATGEVSGQSDTGGLVGRVSSGGGLTVTNSFWDAQTTTQNTTAENKGSGQTTAQMKTFSTFSDAGWPIVDRWQSFAPDADPARVWGIRSDLSGGYPFLLWEYASDPEFACGALVDGVFQVSTVAHLASVGSGGTTTGAGCRLDADYAQTRDITLSGEWTPIGSLNNSFQGSFDGGGHTITGLSITAPTTDGLGLFGALAADGVVERVNLAGVTIESGKRSYTGSLVGDNRGTIKNVSVTGTITVGGGQYTGGIVGYTEGSLTECSATVTISSGDPDSSGIGGVAGLNQNGGEIADCSASGDVSGGFWLGGLVGINQINSTISNSYATGNVTGTNWTGGLVGINQINSTISNSYATGNVSGTNWTGGLVGINQIDSTISNSYATGQPTGTFQTGGLAGSSSLDSAVVSSFYDTTTSGRNDTGKGEPQTTAEMRQLTTFANAGWSIGTCTPRGEPTVWGISDANDDYPFLIWQDPSRLDSCPEPPAPQTSTTAKDPLPEQPVVADAFSNALAPTSTQPSTPEVGSDTATETEGGSSDSPSPGGSQTGSGGGDDGVTSDDQAGSATQSGLNTGWLWGIGLGGLATVGLVAGGIALARNRLA